MSAGLRADARRNRDRVLEAAAEAFAARGPDVSVDEIARRAGVGHGTVFRRFPSKDALIAAIVSERLRELADRAETLLEQPDAGAAFESFVWGVAELHAADRGLFECTPRCSERPEVADATQRLNALVEALVARAQAEGSLRPDVAAADVPLLVGSAIVASTQSGTPDAWRRYVAVVLDGLRAAVAPPAPQHARSRPAAGGARRVRRGDDTPASRADVSPQRRVAAPRARRGSPRLYDD